MKIKLLVGRVSAEGSNSPGDVIDVPDREAYTLITSTPPQAAPKVKKEFAELEKRLESEKEKESEKQAKIIAIQKDEELRGEADVLLTELLAIVATVGSVDPEYKAEFLEKFHEAFVNDAEDEQNNEGDLVDNSGKGPKEKKAEEKAEEGK